MQTRLRQYVLRAQTEENYIRITNNTFTVSRWYM